MDMDNQYDILLGSQKNINSVNKDNIIKIELFNSLSENTEFTVNDAVNSTEVFDEEREKNAIYRIYGRIEYLSLLNGLSANYSGLNNFFNPKSSNDIKNIFNSFDFYLVTPASGTSYNDLGNDFYGRNFQVIATNKSFEIYNAGFSNNVYGEQIYSFNFTCDIDISEMFDYFGFPITEVFIFIQYRRNNSLNEEMSFKKWDSINPIKNILNTTDLTIGSIVKTNNNEYIQDIVVYDKNNFYQEVIDNQKFYIRTKYIKEGINYWLEWSYNPLIPIRLRYLNNIVNTAKLDIIRENITKLKISSPDNSNLNIVFNKSIWQSIVNNPSNVENWDNQITDEYYWNTSTGVIIFKTNANYDFEFISQMWLNYENDFYLVKTYIEENTNGTDYVLVNGTTRIYNDSEYIGVTKFNKHYKIGDELRIRVELTPNPNGQAYGEIPNYATMIKESGIYVWRDILPQGYVEPLTGVGVDYPFINGRRYVYNQIILSIEPNLSIESFEIHDNTIKVFSEISYLNNSIILNNKPLTDLNNIGKPC
jgi:hypothetical protein